jgi:LCP family protein required for cell wall assembly
MRVPQWFVMVWVIVFGIAAVGGSVLTYMFVRDRAAELDSVLDLPDPPQIGEQLVGETGPEQPAAQAATATSTPPPNETTPAEETDQPESTPATGTPAADPGTWDDPRRVTILLLGIDQRQGETGPFPTDTIILLSLDPVGKTAAILSIPRDLWVEYPEVGQSARINAANILGDEINYPGGGGPAYAVKTVQKVLGLSKVNFYVLLNFEVFTQVIDAVGPVEVCPAEPIDDDQYPDGSYGYITIHFDAGCQDLGAERLLQYARTRHDDKQGDIGRSSRQQEVILAVRSKVLSAGGVTALLPKASELWESAQANIRTNLSFEDMVRLARTAENIPADNIRQGQISFEDVTITLTPEGDSVLVPIWTDIRLLMQDLFRPAGAVASEQ